MADLFRQASDWLQSQRRQFATSTVTYRRGADSVDVLASIGSTTFDVDDGAWAMIQIETRDYLITVADLVIDDEPITPRDGDVIVETFGSVEQEYEVRAPGGKPPWRYSDDFRQTFRVHTKGTGESA